MIVTDTGTGIPKPKMKNLFEMFGPLSSIYDHSKTGCGIGLTITN